jgi:hypothetical protein
MHYWATAAGKVLANGTQLRTISGLNGNVVPTSGVSNLSTNDANMVNLVYKNCQDPFNAPSFKSQNTINLFSWGMNAILSVVPMLFA